MKDDTFLNIPGHLLADEGWLLQRLMAGKKVLEIGTHHAKSTVAMAATAKEVDSIDWYKGDAMIGAPDIRVAEASVKASGFQNIRLHIGDWTVRAPSMLENGDYDAVFYDAAHAPPDPYEKDFLAWIHSVGFKGLVALHDYKPFEEAFRHTVKAVEDFVQKSGRNMSKPTPGTSIAWFEPI
jgi:predicted O-methyltransferase YrrM